MPKGGVRQGAGRKPGLNNRKSRWPVRWTKEEQAQIEWASVAASKLPTEIIREATLNFIRIELSKIDNAAPQK